MDHGHWSLRSPSSSPVLPQFLSSPVIARSLSLSLPLPLSGPSFLFSVLSSLGILSTAAVDFPELAAPPTPSMAASTTAGHPAKDEMAEALGKIVDVITGVQQNLLIYLGDMKFHSFVSLACLLLAIVFSWKVLRAEPLHVNRRRRQRRQVPLSGQAIRPQSNVNISSIGEVCSSTGDSRVQDVVDRFFQPIKPTLRQLVRQRLCGGRKVTCQLLGVILEETNPEELQEHATVSPSVLEVLSEISKTCDLYLMERVLDDQTEERVLSALSDAGVFTSCGLVREKVLFCDTENGRTSFVRQLEPEWHIETNPDVIHQLARFIKYQLHIAPNRHEHVAANIFCAASLEQFFGASETS